MKDEKESILDLKSQIFHHIDIFRFFLVIFVFFTFFFPTAYSVIRLTILFGLVISCIIKKGLKINIVIAKKILIFILFNIVAIIWGFIKNSSNPFALQTVDIIWPLMFLFVAHGLQEEEERFFLVRVMLIAEMVTLLFDIVCLGGSLLEVSWNDIFLYLQKVLDYHFGNFGSFFQYTTTHMCTHIFMLPFTMSLYISKQDYINKSILHFIMVLLCICLLMSGRVAFIISSILGICTALLVTLYLNRWKITDQAIIKGTFISIVAAIGLFLIIKISSLELTSIIDYIVYKFRSSADMKHIENGVRALQKKSLLDEWKKAPLLGYGSGAFSKPLGGYDWSQRGYEYSYYYMLFQKGILGVVNYTIFYGSIFWSLIKKAYNKKLDIKYAIPFTVGFLGILIANYADPYLWTMGCMWMIFFPFAIAYGKQKEYKE